MRRHRLTFADSEPAIPPLADSTRGKAVPSPAGPDRREFICGAMLAGSVVAIGWPAFGGGEAADWSDGTAWSDGRGWRS